MAALTVPTQIPVIGGTVLAAANVKLVYLNGHPKTDDYLAVWTSLCSLGTVGFKADFAGGFSLISGANIQTPGYFPSPPNPSALPTHILSTYNVPADTAQLQYTICDPLLGSTYHLLDYQENNHVQVTDPNGQIYYFSLIDPTQIIKDPRQQNNDPTQAAVGQSAAAGPAHYISGPAIPGFSIATVPTVPSLDNSTPASPKTVQVSQPRKRVIIVTPAMLQAVSAAGAPLLPSLTPETWKVDLIGPQNLGYNSLNGPDVVADPNNPILVGQNMALSPIQPGFGPTYNSTTGAQTDQTPTVTQTDLDTIHITSPVDSYNKGQSFTVSVYDSVNGQTAVVGKQTFNFVSTSTDLQHSSQTLSLDIPSRRCRPRRTGRRRLISSSSSTTVLTRRTRKSRSTPATTSPCRA